MAHEGGLLGAARLLGPLIAAPIIASVLAGFGFALFAHLTSYSANVGASADPLALFLDAARGMTLLGALFALPLSLSLLALWHVMMQRRAARSAGAYWSACLVLGVAIAAAVLLGVSDAQGVQAALALFPFLVWAGALGLATGYTFWLIRRPDRDEANAP